MMMAIPVASLRRQLDARIVKTLYNFLFLFTAQEFLEAEVISRIQKYPTTYLLHIAFLYLMFIVDVVIVREVCMCSLLPNILLS